MQGGGSPVERSVAKAQAAYSNSGWDLVDAVQSKEVKVGSLKDDELPVEMRKMSVPEREKYVQGLIARRAEIQVAYMIGVARPASVKVETFGTGDDRAAVEFVNRFDFRPAAIIEQLDLLRPIYRLSTNYGHFGKSGLPWEE